MTEKKVVLTYDGLKNMEGGAGKPENRPQKRHSRKN